MSKRDSSSQCSLELPQRRRDEAKQAAIPAKLVSGRISGTSDRYGLGFVSFSLPCLSGQPYRVNDEVVDRSLFSMKRKLASNDRRTVSNRAVTAGIFIVAASKAAVGAD
jgi:hypothetical protein